MPIDFRNGNHTAEELASDESRAQFEFFYRGLSETLRVAGSVKTLHVWFDGARFHSCDFGITRDTLADLAADCSEHLLGLGHDEPVPVQPRDLWWEFWRRPLQKTYMHYPMRTFRRSNAFCVVRGF